MKNLRKMSKQKKYFSLIQNSRSVSFSRLGLTLTEKRRTRRVTLAPESRMA